MLKVCRRGSFRLLELLKHRKSNKSSARPIKWLEDAVVYTDTHTAFVDPCTSLPYPTEDLVRILEQGGTDNDDVEKPTSRSELKPKIPIEEQVVVLFPGQGAQKVGMGKKLVDCPGSVDLYKKASEILQYDVMKLCLEGPKSKLDQTVYCQPAVFTTSLAAWERAVMMDDSLSSRLTDVAGFSVGEFAAFVLAGVLSFDDALRLVKVRAEAMHECGQKVSSGMITVRVNAASQLDEALADAKKYASDKNEQPICEVANYLFCGVKVIGASLTCMRYLEDTQERYAFQVVKKLDVSGAFHTSLMKGAVRSVRDCLQGMNINEPRVNVYSNFTGKRHVKSKKRICEAIEKQLCSPVKWEQILQLLHAKHQNYKFPTFMEVGPGRQLGAMLSQISKKAYKSYLNCPV